MKVAVIGGGNMGVAFAKSFVKEGLVKGESLLVIDRDESKRAWILEQIQCQVKKNVIEIDSSYEVVVLAVKPQDFSDLAVYLGPVLKEHQLVISIMAGVSIEFLIESLKGHDKVIRAIPNIPARVHAGLTVYCDGPNITKEEEEKSLRLIDATGTAMKVADEALVDAATALVGSGPGFVFYLMEQFDAVAEELGFSPVEAREMVQRTFWGACELLAKSDTPAAEWRGRVTSKGGTTEAGVKAFEDTGVATGIRAGLRGAFERSKELAHGG